MIRPVIDQPGAQVFQDDCRKVMADFPDNSIDAVITDPPYEIRFMGREWDSTGIAYDAEVWTQAIRILKPGGHVLAFGGTRTWHRLAVAIEDAGFEIRDSIAWLYGSGFPKSLDVSKAIDKAAGAEREVVGTHPAPATTLGNGVTMSGGAARYALDITAPATDVARKWQGWGTALKPAFEPIVVARKPLIGTVAENVLAHGTGALNIDGARIGYQSEADKDKALAGDAFKRKDTSDKGWSRPWMEDAERVERMNREAKERAQAGRWPANVILDESQAEALDEQSGVTSSAPTGSERTLGAGRSDLVRQAPREGMRSASGDIGGASRFFYTAKASTAERPRVDGVAHPTVKPLSLMHYLIRLITTPNATILDPFAGSGTTLQAAIQENRQAIGIEITPEYIPLIQQRLQTPTTQTMF